MDYNIIHCVEATRWRIELVITSYLAHVRDEPSYRVYSFKNYDSELYIIVITLERYTIYIIYNYCAEIRDGTE